MINHDTLAKVQAELARFLAALDAVREAETERREAAGIAYAEAIITGKNACEPWVGAYAGGPETAALRRASMDLTRVLAELRRSPR